MRDVRGAINFAKAARVFLFCYSRHDIDRELFVGELNTGPLNTSPFRDFEICLGLFPFAPIILILLFVLLKKKCRLTDPRLPSLLPPYDAGTLDLQQLSQPRLQH